MPVFIYVCLYIIWIKYCIKYSEYHVLVGFGTSLVFLVGFFMISRMNVYYF